MFASIPIATASRTVAATNSFSRLRISATTLRSFSTITTASLESANKNNNACGRRSNGVSLHHLRLPRSLCCVRATNEEDSAKVAATSADLGGPTIFDKIISKEIPSTIVYEDEKVLAFRDINPQAPVHVLIIPKFRDGLTQLGKAEPRHADILGHLLYAAKIVAEKEGILDGFRTVINNGPSACQSVYHIHLHVLGGRQMKWPPG